MNGLPTVRGNDLYGLACHQIQLDDQLAFELIGVYRAADLREVQFDPIDRRAAARGMLSADGPDELRHVRTGRCRAPGPEQEQRSRAGRRRIPRRTGTPGPHTRTARRICAGPGPRRSADASSTDAESSRRRGRVLELRQRAEQTAELVAKRPRLGVGEQQARKLGACSAVSSPSSSAWISSMCRSSIMAAIIPWSSSTSLSSWRAVKSRDFTVFSGSCRISLMSS